MTSAVNTIDRVVMVWDHTPMSPTRISEAMVPIARRPPAICQATSAKKTIISVGGTEFRAQSKPFSIWSIGHLMVWKRGR